MLSWRGQVHVFASVYWRERRHDKLWWLKGQSPDRVFPTKSTLLERFSCVQLIQNWRWSLRRVLDPSESVICDGRIT